MSQISIPTSWMLMRKADPPVSPKGGQPVPGPRKAHINDKTNPNEPMICHAFVSSWKSTGERSDKDPTNCANKQPYYVIIGRGYTAVVNHATLLQSDYGKKRINGYKVLHIGYRDPWLTYANHEMNQNGHLMVLPGFKSQHDGKMFKGEWLWSADFAKVTDQEMTETVKAERKRGYEPRAHFRAHVVKIEKDETVGYRIHTVSTDGYIHRPIHAAKIDICTGPGQSRLYDSNRVKMDDSLWHQYRQPPPVERQWCPRICTSGVYMRQTIEVTDGSVCVIGGGPAGIQAVERALGIDRGGGNASEVLWVGNGLLNGAFNAGGRFDELARIRDGQPIQPLRFGEPRDQDYGVNSTAKNPTYDFARLSPRTVKHAKMGRVWFGEDHTVREVMDFDEKTHGKLFESAESVEDRTGKVLIKFAINGKLPRLCKAEFDWSRKPLLEYAVFDQVVFAIGLQDTSVRRSDPIKSEPGNGINLIDQFMKKSPDVKLGEISSLTGLSHGHAYQLGMQCDKGDIRILGGVGQRNALSRRAPFEFDKSESSALVKYESSLPLQARVNQQGVTLCAATIARANGYFLTELDKRMNHNVNTATLDELETILPAFAEDLVYARSFRRTPFVSTKQAAGAVVAWQKRQEVEFFRRDHQKKDPKFDLPISDEEIEEIWETETLRVEEIYTRIETARLSWVYEEGCYD